MTRIRENILISLQKKIYKLIYSRFGCAKCALRTLDNKHCTPHITRYCFSSSVLHTRHNGKFLAWVEEPTNTEAQLDTM